MTERPRTEHPLVDSYLRELEMLLHGIEPVERAEVVDGVREHLAACLHATSHSDQDVRAALAEVGPAAAVADEAYRGRPVPPAAPTRTAVPGAWIPGVVAVFEALALLGALAVASSSTVVMTGSSVSTTAAGHTITKSQTEYDGSPAAAFLGVFGAAPFWLVVVVLVIVCRLWTTREKSVLIALPLLPVACFALLPPLGYVVAGVDGVYVGGWLTLGLTVLGGAVALTVLVRRALARTAT